MLLERRRIVWSIDTQDISGHVDLPDGTTLLVYGVSSVKGSYPQRLLAINGPDAGG
jgi:hypothetical protein